MEMIGLLGLAAFNTTFMSLNTVSPGGPHTKPRSARCTRLLLRTCRRPLATCNWHLCTWHSYNYICATSIPASDICATTVYAIRIHATNIHAIGSHATCLRAIGIHANGIHAIGISASGIHARGIHASAILETASTPLIWQVFFTNLTDHSGKAVWPSKQERDGQSCSEKGVFGLLASS